MRILKKSWNALTKALPDFLFYDIAWIVIARLVGIAAIVALIVHFGKYN